jgi:5-(carboxyamino)imidazole ribonucleotide synthase
VIELQIKKVIYPPAKVGIIGGGQLGRMIAREAQRLGYYVIVLDPAEDAPAAQAANEQIVADFNDVGAITQLLRAAQVITYEFEHINVRILREFEEKGAVIIPSAQALEKLQDKYTQKAMLKSRGLSVPEFWNVNESAEINQAIEQKGLPLVLKTCCDGYDGKGNFVLRHISDVDRAVNFFGGKRIYLEEYIDYKKELSVMIAVDALGNTVRYPVVENIHTDGILHMTKVPAEIDRRIDDQITKLAREAVVLLGSAGVFCIEMFQDASDRLYINEIAPRPHNSGHYTIEACVASQFEQLLRIMVGMPLGSAGLLSPCAMVNILGDSDWAESEYYVSGLDKVLAVEKAYFHWYGKSKASNLRKLGHITVLSDSAVHAAKSADEALAQIQIKRKKEDSDK